MINDSIDNIRLDLNMDKVKACIYAGEGDTKTRTVHCTLTDNGKVVELGNAVFAQILINRADGSKADNYVVVYGNELQYTWRTEDLKAVGDNKCQFMVTFDDGAIVTSPEFSLIVHKVNQDRETEQSMNEYTALSEMVVQAGLYASTAEEKASEANTALSEVTDIVEQVTEAADSATEAAASANASETIVASYATSASESATTAGTYADSAMAYRDSAETYKTAAATSATAAAASESAASGYSASCASYQEEYAESLTAAEAASESASGYATEASTSATEASTSATAAAASETNAKTWYDKTYEIYEKIGEGTLVLGETSTTAHRGDHGVAAYNHSLVTSGNPHNVTAAEVGAVTTTDFNSHTGNTVNHITAEERTKWNSADTKFNLLYNMAAYPYVPTGAESFEEIVAETMVSAEGQVL